MTGDPPTWNACGTAWGGCTCGPYWSVVPPGPCPKHSACAPVSFFTIPAPASTPSNRLSDEDIDRVARRLAELIGKKEATS